MLSSALGLKVPVLFRSEITRFPLQGKREIAQGRVKIL